MKKMLCFTDIGFNYHTMQLCERFHTSSAGIVVIGNQELWK